MRTSSLVTVSERSRAPGPALSSWGSQPRNKGEDCEKILGKNFFFSLKKGAQNKFGNNFAKNINFQPGLLI